MTKEQLKNKIEELEDKIGELEDKIGIYENDLEFAYEEQENLENQLEDALSNQGDLKSLENFTWRLKLENLYVPELEKFIDNYMMFYND